MWDQMQIQATEFRLKCQKSVNLQEIKDKELVSEVKFWFIEVVITNI